jgi:hypothetical protein
MGKQSTVFPESIDEVLTAVMETPRGRWFLEAYRDRIKGDGTANILQAISRLENSLTSMTIGGADANILQQTREAIAAAKREIALLEPKSSELSAEGQLFAKLAELSRAAFQGNSSTQPTIARGVDRVLKLVTEIDQKLGGESEPIKIAVAATKLIPQYFKADEEIFEPAPTPTIVEVKKPESVIATPNRGAKLVIQRIGKGAAPSESGNGGRNTVAIEPQAVEQAREPVDAKNSESRIVIIRRKAEEIVEVPLMEEVALESMTAA